MAVLTNFGVAPTDGGDVAATIMPKLQYRFRVAFDFPIVQGGQFLTGNVMSVTRPTLSHEEVTVDTYNSKIYLAGKHTWEPVTITLRDDVNNQVMKALDNQMAQQVNHSDQSSAKAGAGYKFVTKIDTLNGGNADAEVLDRWTLAGCYIQNIAYGESNYATSDSQQITVTLRYDNASHVIGEDGDDQLSAGAVSTAQDKATN